MLLSLDLLELAAAGVHLDISNEKQLPVNLGELVRLIKKNNGHITISGHALLPSALLDMAKLAGKHLTIKF